MFHVGQKVVCINGDFSARKLETIRLFTTDLPLKGQVYTVVGVLEHDGIPALELAEFPPAPVEPIGDFVFVWRMDRFRPVKETSIEVFRSLLNPVPELEDA